MGHLLFCNMKIYISSGLVRLCTSFIQEEVGEFGLINGWWNVEQPDQILVSSVQSPSSNSPLVFPFRTLGSFSSLSSSVEKIYENLKVERAVLVNESACSVDLRVDGDSVTAVLTDSNFK